MKTLRAIILMAGILVAGIAFNTMAQGASDNARDAYAKESLGREKHRNKSKAYKCHRKAEAKAKHVALRHKQKSGLKKAR